MNSQAPIAFKGFSGKLNLLLFVPIIIVFTGWAASQYIPGGGLVVLAILAASIIYLYWAQLSFLQQRFPQKSQMAHLYIVFIALLAPIISIIFGDGNGARTYSVAANGIKPDLIAGFYVGALLALLCLFFIDIGNALYIKTSGKIKAIDIIGRIFYVIGYVAIALVTWLAYATAYSAHDPHSE